MRRVPAALSSVALLVNLLAPGAVAAPGSSAPLRATIDVETDDIADCPTAPSGASLDDSFCWAGRIHGDGNGTAASFGTPEYFFPWDAGKHGGRE